MLVIYFITSSPITLSYLFLGIPGGLVVENLLAVQETWVQSLGQEDPLEKEKATHSNIIA